MSVSLFGSLDVSECGKEEAQGFARPSLPDGDEVSARHGDGPPLGLDGHGLGEPRPREELVDAGGEVDLVEGRHRSRTLVFIVDDGDVVLTP